MKNMNYWKKRAEERMDISHAKAVKTAAALDRLYDNAMRQIDSDIKNIFENAGNLEGMTHADVLELLNETISTKVLEQMMQRIAQIKDEEAKRKAMNIISIQAYKARITRKEALRQSIQSTLSLLADKEYSYTTKHYVNTIKDTYSRTMFDISKGIGYEMDFAKVSKRRVETILAEDWSGKHYSKRIWGNVSNYGQVLEDQLLKQITTGIGPQKAAQQLSDITNVAKFNCERLLRTETTYFTNKSDIEASKDAGIKKLRFLATLDDRTSPICQEHDGKLIDIDKAQPGKNVPPLHPFCRSTTIVTLDGWKYKERIAKDSNGKYIKVPASTTYAQWKEKYGGE